MAKAERQWRRSQSQEREYLDQVLRRSEELVQQTRTLIRASRQLIHNASIGSGLTTAKSERETDEIP